MGVFGNLVNRHDFAKLLSKVTARDWRSLAERLRPGAGRRVSRAWRHVRGRPAHWWDVPGMRQRWNRFVSSDPEIDARTYLARRFLGGDEPRRALSLGCGAGDRELAWGRTGVFRTLDAIDLSPTRIEFARDAARDAGLDRVVHFSVGDVLAHRSEEPYDVIIAEQSLHHFAPMERVLEHVRDLLVPGGMFLIDEFVGSSRFQWTDAQLIATNELLATLPDRYRLQWHDARPKRTVFRPSRLSMRLRDPSEAVESSAILPGLRARFDVLETRGYGGSVLHLLFENIAQNFRDGSDETRELIERCFAFEDRAMRERGLPDDFVVAACRRA